jgi:hypothetical protein
MHRLGLELHACGVTCISLGLHCAILYIPFLAQVCYYMWYACQKGSTKRSEWSNVSFPDAIQTFDHWGSFRIVVWKVAAAPISTFALWTVRTA